MESKEMILSSYYGKEISKKMDAIIENQKVIHANQKKILEKLSITPASEPTAPSEAKSAAIDKKMEAFLDQEIKDLIKKKFIPNRLGQGLLRGKITTFRQFIGTKKTKMLAISRFGDLCIEQADEVMKKFRKKFKLVELEFGDKI